MGTPRFRLGPRVGEAFAWVLDLHADQSRKGTDVPFASHLLAVAALTLEDGGDEEDAVIALCHDAVEDQGGLLALAEVRRRFGDRVADAVDLLSDSYGEPRAPWAERKRTLVARMGAEGIPPSVLRVAAADKLHNARTLLAQLRRQGDRAWRRFEATPAEVVGYYRAMATVLSQRHPGSVNVDQLARVVTELDVWVTDTEPAVTV